MMALDDVVKSTHPDPQRMEEAMRRSLRWLDRCSLAITSSISAPDLDCWR